jgi:dihydrofolate reductase
MAARPVVFSAAMSLDGYIAGPKGEFDWVTRDPDMDFAALMRRFDTALMGRRTWEAALEQGQGALPGMRNIVVSRTLDDADCPGAELTADPVMTVRDLKGQPGKDIWLFGGASLFRSLLDAGLVDSVELAVIPVLLGSGLRLRPDPSATLRFELTGHRIFGRTGIVWLAYAPRHRSRREA